MNEGWVLVRPSNTSPIIRLTAEADDEMHLNQLEKQFKNRLNQAIKKVKR